jgi:hypothetical protein
VNVEDQRVVQLDEASDPVWSPDGAFIALTDMDSGGGQQAIEIANADGSGRRVLASGEFLNKGWVP